MSKRQSSLELGPGSHGVREARRWVRASLGAIGRTDLIECAELAVSELVTNALLHAEAPVGLELHGTKDHPRVEVRDSSTSLPTVPTTPLSAPMVDLDTIDIDANLDVLAGALSTYGRGLDLVSRTSAAWGTEIDLDGKTVWFEPTAEIIEGQGAPPIVTGSDAGREPTSIRRSNRVTVQLTGVPEQLYLGFVRHYRDMRREIRLLVLTHHADYALARGLSRIFGTLETPLTALDLDVDQIREHSVQGILHLEFRVALSVADRIDEFIALLEIVDQFCREERLLAVARSEEQREFQGWILDEIAQQARGRRPVAYGAEVTFPATRAQIS